MQFDRRAASKSGSITTARPRAGPPIGAQTIRRCTRTQQQTARKWPGRTRTTELRASDPALPGAPSHAQTVRPHWERQAERAILELMNDSDLRRPIAPTFPLVQP